MRTYSTCMTNAQRTAFFAKYGISSWSSNAKDLEIGSWGSMQQKHFPSIKVRIAWNPRGMSIGGDGQWSDDVRAVATAHGLKMHPHTGSWHTEDYTVFDAALADLEELAAPRREEVPVAAVTIATTDYGGVEISGAGLKSGAVQAIAERFGFVWSPWTRAWHTADHTVFDAAFAALWAVTP